MSGIFITFEGIDGCGKSTQIQLLAEYLTANSRAYIISREPGGTAIGDQIRTVLLSNANQKLTPTAELLLYAASRAQHVQERLRPALNAGQIVLCDRYTDATVAYQGYGRNLSLELIDQLNQIATQGLIPNITLLFDLAVEASQSRMHAAAQERQGGDRLDNESYEFHQRVRQGYLTLAAQQPHRFRVIPAQGTPSEVFAQVCQALTTYLSS